MKGVIPVNFFKLLEKNMHILKKWSQNIYPCIQVGIETYVSVNIVYM